MSLRSSISLSALTLALTSSAAFADVTAADVWEDWKGYMAGFGYEMSGTESASGGVLSVSGVAMTYPLPEDGGSMTFTIGDLTFTETGSGSVDIALPTEMPIAFDVTTEDGEAAKGVVMIRQVSPTMIASGDADNLTYTSSADEVSIGLDALEVDGEVMPPEMFNMNVTLTDASNITRTSRGDLRAYTQTMSIAQMAYTVAVNIPDGPDAGEFTATGGASNLSFDGGGDIPTTVDSTDMSAMIDAGFNVDGEFTYGAGNLSVNAVTPDGPFVASTTSDGGALSVKMGNAGLDYDVSQSNLKISAEKIPDFPFPVNIEMAKSAFNLLMPLRASDDEQAFGFGLTLGEFTISDVIWNLFDPAEQLPRDPATISLDMSGKAKVLVDFTDPEQMEQLENGGVPGEVNALDINTILLSAVGTELTGSGAFTFDNTDTVTFDGFPKPTGALNVRLSGANKLMDTLVTMGLLPQEQAMGARMMMGLFGVAEGDDVLTSKVEVNDDGHVLANGQRLR